MGRFQAVTRLANAYGTLLSPRLGFAVSCTFLRLTPWPAFFRRSRPGMRVEPGRSRGSRCTLSGAEFISKIALFALDLTKQKVGNSPSSQICGSKGSYGQNPENMRVTEAFRSCRPVQSRNIASSVSTARSSESQGRLSSRRFCKLGRCEV